MMHELRAGAPAGVTWTDIAWDDETVNWNGFDAAIIGTAWDYWDRQEAFLAKLNQIATQTRLFNQPDLVAWNSHKSYLRDMEARGARLIQTLWLDEPTPDTVKTAFERLKTDDLVLKRQVGAGAEGQYRLKRGDLLPTLTHPMMAQPFLAAILEEGEYSFIFIDGAFSHALVKRAAKGDYRIQSSYGGTDHPITPPPRDLAAARAMLDAVETKDGKPPLYARIDMLRAEDGGLLLMELEAIEPFLYPLEGPGLGALIGNALLKRLAT